MKTSALFEIGETRKLHDEVPSNASEFRDIDELFSGFLTEVALRPNGYAFIVDSFSLLHAILAQAYLLQSASKLSLHVGEGLELRGRRTDLSNEIFELQFVVTDFVEHRISIGTGQLLFMLGKLVTDLTTSIEETGIDVFESLERFPPALF